MSEVVIRSQPDGNRLNRGSGYGDSLICACSEYKSGMVLFIFCHWKTDQMRGTRKAAAYGELDWLVNIQRG